jgi:hypothetical protein
MPDSNPGASIGGMVCWNENSDTIVWSDGLFVSPE